MCFAGCVGESSAQPSLDEISLVTNKTKDVDVKLRAKRSGELVHEETYTLPGRDGQTIESRTIVGDWMGEPVEYDVKLEEVGTDRSASQSTSDIKSYVSNWGDIMCYKMAFTVEEQDISTSFTPLEKCQNTN